MKNINGISIDPENYKTNMVFCTVDDDKGESLTESLSKRGVLVGHVGDSVLRLVTHHGINEDDIDYTLKTIENILFDL